MMIYHDLMPSSPPAPRCRRCGRVMDKRNIMTGFHELTTGLWCWHCQRFNPESKP